MAAGVIPDILEACPGETGLILISFSMTSVESRVTDLKSKSSGLHPVGTPLLPRVTKSLGSRLFVKENKEIE